MAPECNHPIGDSFTQFDGDDGRNEPVFALRPTRSRLGPPERPTRPGRPGWSLGGLCARPITSQRKTGPDGDATCPRFHRATIRSSAHLAWPCKCSRPPLNGIIRAMRLRASYAHVHWCHWLSQGPHARNWRTSTSPAACRVQDRYIVPALNIIVEVPVGDYGRLILALCPCPHRPGWFVVLHCGRSNLGQTWGGLLWVPTMGYDDGVPAEAGCGRENQVTNKLPNNWSTAVPKRHPWRFRRAPKRPKCWRKVAQQLSRCCSGSRNSAQIRSNWPIWDKFGVSATPQTLAKCGQILAPTHVVPRIGGRRAKFGAWPRSAKS